MSRLAAMFNRLRDDDRGGLSVYIAAGHPDLATSEAMASAAIEGGADWLELGIPFSDPAADGPVIEAATAAAIEAGFHVDDGLAMAARLRAQHPDVPLVAMTYANIAFRMGWDTWASRLAEAGIDACILPDVPLEESAPVRAALTRAGVGWVPLVTPTTPADRMGAIMATATGFVYVVSNVGITGQADPGPLVEATVARARASGSDVPLAVGFGIASGDDVRRVIDAGADGAIVGSHIVGQIHEGASPDGIKQAVAKLAQGVAPHQKH